MEKYEPLKQIKNIKTGIPEKTMNTYTKVYLDNLGFDETDYVQCQCCENRATEIHHIISRKRDKKLINDIQNLFAICRTCHQKYGEIKEYMPLLLKIHRAFLRNNGVHFSEEYFTQKLAIYDKDSD